MRSVWGVVFDRNGPLRAGINVSLLKRTGPSTWSKGLEGGGMPSGVEAVGISISFGWPLRGAAGDVLYRPEPPTGFVLEAFLCRVVLKWRFRWPLEVNHLSQASHWYKKVWSLTLFHIVCIIIVFCLYPCQAIHLQIFPLISSRENNCQGQGGLKQMNKIGK